jgi:hypothetical protein
LRKFCFFTILKKSFFVLLKQIYVLRKTASFCLDQRSFKKFISVLVLLLLGGNGWVQNTGIYESYIILNINNAGNTFYDLNASTANIDFSGANLGTFLTGNNTLVIAGGENKTYKCSGGDITGGNTNYRVYLSSGSAPSFTSLAMSWVSNDAGGCGGNQTWRINNNTTNIISSLAPGAYTLEVYSDAPGWPYTAYASNSGANYKASFTVVNQALPVELMSFSGNCADGQVNLEWQTASEHNSLYFEVEKSRDGENWQVLSTVPSAGNSTELLTYSALDAHAGEGNNYYRLNQVDIDGANKVYDIINVSCSGGNKGYFSTYPNPSSGAFQVVLNNKEMLGSATLSIRDTKGASLLQRAIEVKPGINLFSINDLNLAPGVYYIQVINGDQTTEVIKEVIR